MAQGVDATKTAARPSHEAIEQSGEEATEQQKIDRVLMEAARRGNNQIHSDETVNPGSSEFTK